MSSCGAGGCRRLRFQRRSAAVCGPRWVHHHPLLAILVADFALIYRSWTSFALYVYREPINKPATDGRLLGERVCTPNGAVFAARGDLMHAGEVPIASGAEVAPLRGLGGSRAGAVTAPGQGRTAVNVSAPGPSPPPSRHEPRRQTVRRRPRVHVQPKKKVNNGSVR